MGLNKWPSDEIIGQLVALRPGAEIIVHWRDACGFRDVPFPEDVYLTLKVTRGAFYSLIDDHLILISEETHGLQSYEGTCIPIGCIVHIEVLRSRGRKASKKTAKAEVGYPMKIIYEVEKVGRHEQAGEGGQAA